MKRMTQLLCSAMLAVSTVGVASAQDFPSQPIQMVIPYAAGGTSDILGRLIQEPLSRAAGVQVVVENKPGGASVIGTSQVARAKADGHTVLLADLALIVNPSLMKDLPYDTTKDFRAVTALATAPLVMLAHKDVPANNYAELAALAKEKPGELNFASGGYGTSTHMAGEMLKSVTDLDITHVPYSGVAPAMHALLSGQVDIYFGGTTTALQHLQTGALKAIAVTGEERNSLLPDVPTFSEQGIEGMNADTYWGVYVPAGTPDDRVAALNGFFKEAMSDPAVVKRAQEFGVRLIHNAPEEQQKTFVEMVDSWKQFTSDRGIKLE